MDITGKPRGDCIRALAANNNDINAAAEYLLTMATNANNG